MPCILSDDTQRTIAQELLAAVRKTATIDRSMNETARARLLMVRRILRKYGYPPDMQEKATATVLEQAELMARGEAA